MRNEHREHVRRRHRGNGLLAEPWERILRENRPPALFSLAAILPGRCVHRDHRVRCFLKRRHRLRPATWIASGTRGLPVRLCGGPRLRGGRPLRRAEPDLDALSVDEHPLDVGLA